MVRVKRRYILFEIIPNDAKLMDRLPFAEKDVFMAIRDCVQTLYGDFGLASIQHTCQLKRFNTSTRSGVLMCNRGSHKLVLTALPFVRAVKQCQCVLNTLHVSGTIRSSLKKLRVHHYRQIALLRQQLSGRSGGQVTQIESGVKDIEQSLSQYKQQND